MPDEVLEHCFGHIAQHDRAHAMAGVSRRWRRLNAGAVESMRQGRRVADAVARAGDVEALLHALRGDFTPPQLAAVEAVSLAGRHLDDAGALTLCAELARRCPNLRTLDLSYNQLSDTGLRGLALPAGLRALNVARNQLGGGAFVAPMAWPPALRALNFGGNPEIDDAWLQSLGLPADLRVIGLAGCRVTAAALPLLPDGLEVLDISHGPARRAADTVLPPRLAKVVWTYPGRPPDNSADLEPAPVADGGFQAFGAYTSDVAELERQVMSPRVHVQPSRWQRAATLGLGVGVGAFGAAIAGLATGALAAGLGLPALWLGRAIVSGVLGGMAGGALAPLVCQYIKEARRGIQLVRACSASPAAVPSADLGPRAAHRRAWRDVWVQGLAIGQAGSVLGAGAFVAYQWSVLVYLLPCGAGVAAAAATTSLLGAAGGACVGVGAGLAVFAAVTVPLGVGALMTCGERLERSGHDWACRLTDRLEAPRPTAPRPAGGGLAANVAQVWQMYGMAYRQLVAGLSAVGR